MFKGKDLETLYLAEGKAFKRSNTTFFNTRNAISFIEACRHNGIEILGIDGFFLNEQSTQPSMEDSVDFTPSLASQISERYTYLFDFLNTNRENMYFEVVFNE